MVREIEGGFPSGSRLHTNVARTIIPCRSRATRREGFVRGRYFISYTSSDRDWAFWISKELEGLGHTPHVHDRTSERS